MKWLFVIPALFFLPYANAQQTPKPQPPPPAPSLVDYNGFMGMTKKLKKYRKDRLVNLDQFLEMAKDESTIILDTRSARAYELRHWKGAVHLNFSDFTEEKLAKMIPNKDTRILIYCNNNFKDDPINFASKSKPLALNIPTFINLHGYGYENIYELEELVSVKDPKIEFEGTYTALNIH